VRSPCAVPVSRAFVCWVLRLPFGFVSFGGGVGVVVFWFCLRLFAIPFVLVDGPVARWLRHRPTEPGISASSPAGVIVAWLRGFIGVVLSKPLAPLAQWLERWSYEP
jgi:hypothetical protein